MTKRDAYGLLIEEFNRQPLLQQEALTAYFARVRILVMETIITLLGECDHVQHAIVTLAVDKLCRLDHHRVIFKRSSTLPPRRSSNKKARQQFEDRRFLEQAMDIADGYTSRDLDFQAKVVNDLALTRYEFCSILDGMDEVAAEYIEAHNSCVSKRKLKQSTKKEKALMTEIEDTWGLHRLAAYGVFQMVLKRITAIRHLHQQVFNAYARLLLGVANSTSNPEHRMDTIQDGASGLWYAIASYDHVSPNAFSVHAKWWIRQQVLHKMKIAFSAIKPSVGLWQHSQAVDKTKRQHEIKYGTLATDEIPVNVTLSPQQLDAVNKHQHIMQVTSLDALVHLDGNVDKDAGSLTVQSALSDQDRQAELSDTEERTATIQDLLSVFDPVTKRLMCFHFGLWDYLRDQKLDKTLVLRERIRQLTAHTLRSLKST
jgi:DNA-directed RNA polymerase sigma subunit (sigma70/sigma32)